jgi:hypothetical protein
VLARVRCVVDGLRHSTWKDLADLRLPDPARPPRREGFPAAPADRLSGADAGGDDEGATRPHALLAPRCSRPRKPEHARTPPVAPDRPEAVFRAAPVNRPRPPANPNRRRRSDELSRA